jgi:hypothetical protein
MIVAWRRRTNEASVLQQGDVMNKIRKAVLAVSVVVLASGCVHTQALDQAEGQAAPVAEAKSAPQATPALRPMQSYGTYGGYRYRRFTGV